MAFVTKVWKDRLAEFAGRRKLINVPNGTEMTVDVTRQEGQVSQAGDAFSAANMNNLEQRIKNEFDSVNSNLPFALGIDADGNYGYVKAGADSVTPFRSKPLIFTSSPVDIKAVLPDVWDKLTVDDFMVGCVSSSCLNTVGNSFFQGSLNPGVAKPSITYSNDGLLTIKNYSYRFTHTGTGANYWDFKTIGAFAVYKGTVGGK